MFLAFFASFVLLAYLNIYIRCAAAAAALILTAVIVLKRKKHPCHQVQRKTMLMVTIAVVVSSLYSAGAYDFYAGYFDRFDGMDDYAVLEITECEYSLSYISRYRAVVRSSGILPKGTKILISTPSSGLTDGTLLEGTLTYADISTTDSVSFEGKRYYISKRIMITAEEQSMWVTGINSGFSPARIFRKLNSRLTDMITAHTDSTAGGIASAVLLGNRDYVTDTVSRDFRRIGVSHLLVVSGTHFAVILSLTDSMMAQTGLKRRKRSAVKMIVILIFMGITGFSASVVRAGIMQLLIQLGIITGRRANSLNSLAFAGCLLVCINPFSAIDVGMQLSFLATLTCIVFRRAQKTKNRKEKSIGKSASFLRTVKNSVLLTAMITFVSLPLSWVYYGEISLLSVPANIVFIPLITMIMYVTLLYLILYPVRILIPVLGTVINALCGVSSTAAGFLSSFRFSLIAVNYTFCILVFIPVTVILLIIPYQEGKIRKVMTHLAVSLASLFVLLLAAVNIVSYYSPYLTYIPVKKNDGFVFRAKNKVLICDMSDASFSYSAYLTEEVHDMHLCEIEAYMLTHYHSKHIRLLTRLCERQIVRTLILPEPVNDSEKSVYESLCITASEYGLEIYTLPVGGSFDFCGYPVSLPDKLYLSRSTHPVSSVSVDSDSGQFLLVSCSFNESPLLIEAAENADMLILGNHSPVYKKDVTLNCFTDKSLFAVGSQALESLDFGFRKQVTGYEVSDYLRIKMN